jgi:predicted DCC family thiol-disulfide oxidoreductase YuxK
LQEINKQRSIVFFDGVCGLCNGFVNFLLKIDKNHALFFAPLQGETAKFLEVKEAALNTIVFYDKGKLYKRSTAVLMIFKRVSGFWKIFLVFNIVPLFVRDFFYDVIAKYRYRLFSKRAECRVPASKEKKYFLL